MKSNIKTIAIISMMIALSYVLQIFENFYPAILTPYLRLEPSDIPAIFVGIFYGPLYGISVELYKNILHAIFISKDPAFSGEIANFFAGSAYLLPVSLYALVNRSKLKTAKFKQIFFVLSIYLNIGTLSLAAIMAFVNYFITLPLYGISDHALRIE
ncbi:MAG: ECF transporter S component, partial [Erysipelotrichaceae bacterium]